MNKLGIDVGGVIIDHANDNSDTSFFSNRYLETTAVHGAFEAIKILNTRFKQEVYLVSKCGVKTMEKTKEWLRYHKFYDITGAQESNAHFCLTRQEKVPIAEKLGLTHFIDDRLEILGYLTSTVPNLYLFNPSTKEVAKYIEYLSKVIPVREWEEILDKLILE